MKKKDIKKLKKLVDVVETLEDKRTVCQLFSDIGNCGINFKVVDDNGVEIGFQQIKEIVACLK